MSDVKHSKENIHHIEAAYKSGLGGDDEFDIVGGDESHAATQMAYAAFMMGVFHKQRRHSVELSFVYGSVLTWYEVKYMIENIE